MIGGAFYSGFPRRISLNFTPKCCIKGSWSVWDSVGLRFQGLGTPFYTQDTLRYPRPLVIGCGLVFLQQAGVGGVWRLGGGGLGRGVKGSGSSVQGV